MRRQKALLLPGLFSLLISASIACASVGLGRSTPTPQADTSASADPDHDGILGSQDQCPNQPETYNGVFDTDGCPDTLQDLINLATQDIDHFWRGEFAAGNVAYTSPAAITAYTAAQPVETACGESIPDNAFYCSQDNSIYYDEGLIQKILQAKNYGDFGTVVVLAHEWGHLAQAEMDITRSTALNIELELQADCFAGAYGRYLAQQQSNLLRLDEGDLQEGANILYALGDDQMAWFDPQAHGTRQQRKNAYLTGLDKGTSGCLNQ